MDGHENIFGNKIFIAATMTCNAVCRATDGVCWCGHDGAFMLQRRQWRDTRRQSRDTHRLSRDARRLSLDRQRYKSLLLSLL